MEKEKNELALFDSVKVNTFCSKSVEKDEEKKELYNALEKCDVLLNECVGEEIVIKDVYCEENKKEFFDEKTGEVKIIPKYRTILFAENGQTYATGSYGIYNAIKKLIAIYDFPTWEPGVKVKVAKKPIGDGKSSLTLVLI